MKKYGSQIIVALVCALLGFMLSYQLKMISRDEIEIDKKNDTTDITVEIEQLKSQKQDIEKKYNELMAKTKKYEEAATNKNEITKEIKNELDKSRILIGSVDVEGPGVMIHITPNTSFLSGNIDLEVQPISGSDLVSIVNELNSAGAEAVAINDIRITSRSGIRDAGKYIVINDIRISPLNIITIKAIGDKKGLDGAVNFPFALPSLSGYTITPEVKDKIKIPKYNKSYDFKYAKPVDKQ